MIQDILSSLQHELSIKHDFQVRVIDSPPHLPLHIDGRIIDSIQKSFTSFERCELKGFYDIESLTIDIASKDNKYTTFLFNLSLCLIGFLCRFFSKRFNTKPLKLHLTIVTYNARKRINMHKEFLHPINVNSGITIYKRLTRHSRVVVYRSEELVKVLIHELIHGLDIDFKFDYDPQSLVDFFNLDRLCKPLLINECYTDTLAVIINSCLYSLLFQKNVKTVLSSERKFMREQARKVLKLYGYKSNDNDCKLVTDSKICEKTPAISYYVIKAMMLNRIEEFFDNIQDFSSFSRLIETSIYDCKFIRYLNINSYEKKGTTNMRMSFNDIYRKITTSPMYSVDNIIPLGNKYPKY